jgi:hypothetical protein
LELEYWRIAKETKQEEVREKTTRRMCPGIGRDGTGDMPPSSSLPGGASF